MTFGEAGSSKRGSFGQGGFGGKKKREDQPRSYSDRPKKKSWLPETEDADGHPIEMTAEQRQKLWDRAMNLCIWFLGQSPKTAKQLDDAMRKKDVPEDIREGVLAKLEENKYLDDQAFADSYVRSRSEGQRQGSQRIRRDLRQKGVSDDVASASLEAIDPDSERAQALELVQRKLPSTRTLDRNKRTTRLVGMLQRKGYPMGMAFEVIREALETEAENGDG